jgi:hypothetical protein
MHRVPARQIKTQARLRGSRQPWTPARAGSWPGALCRKGPGQSTGCMGPRRCPQRLSCGSESRTGLQNHYSQTPVACALYIPSLADMSASRGSHGADPLCFTQAHAFGRLGPVHA